MFGKTVVCSSSGSSSPRKMAGPEDECMVILQNIRTTHSTQHHVPETTRLAQAKEN
jgi:hypothetical protein